MKKIGHIIKGWGKALGFVSVSTAEKKLSDLRMMICDACAFSEPSKVLEFLNGEEVLQDSLRCTKCKCPCLEKGLVVDESCPISKW